MKANRASPAAITDREFLSSMQLSEKMGDICGLGSAFAWFRRLAASTDPEIQAEYNRLRSVFVAGRAIEEIHGRGSLLKLDHPLVAQFIGKGVIVPERQANAARYQSWLNGQGAVHA